MISPPPSRLYFFMLEFFKPYKITTVFLGARIAAALKYFNLDLATVLLEPVKFRQKKMWKWCSSSSSRGLKVDFKSHKICKLKWKCLGPQLLSLMDKILWRFNGCIRWALIWSGNQTVIAFYGVALICVELLFGHK